VPAVSTCKEQGNDPAEDDLADLYTIDFPFTMPVPLIEPAETCVASTELPAATSPNPSQKQPPTPSTSKALTLIAPFSAPTS
jgi:hypothetical protein